MSHYVIRAVHTRNTEPRGRRWSVACCHRRCGLTIVECLVCLACVITLLTLCAFARPGGQDDGRHPRSLADMKQVRELMQVMLIYGSEANDGLYPRPGLIDRLPDPAGRIGPRVGEEDIEQNTTANLYAALVAQRYIAPEVIISPIERSPNVSVDDDYDYDSYNPTEDTYWDDAFSADLATESNTSYAHLPLYGQRMKRHWRSTFDARICVLGNRGPAEGKPNPDSYTCDPHGMWTGHVAFNDGHVELFRDMAPPSLPGLEGEADRPDNLFAFDPGPDGGDIVLTFTAAMGEDGPVTQHD